MSQPVPTRRTPGARRTRRALPATLAVVLVAVAACGASDNTTAVTSTTSVPTPTTGTDRTVPSTTTTVAATTSTTLATTTTTTHPAPTTTPPPATTTTAPAPTTTPPPPATTTTLATTTTTTAPAPPTTSPPPPSPDEQPYLDSFATDVRAGDGAEIFDEAQAKCLARRFLDVIGLDRLRNAGVEPDDFNISANFGEKLGVDATEGNQLYDQFASCGIDVEEVLVKSLSAGGQDLTPEERACVDAAFGPDDVRRSFVADVIGQDLTDDPLDRIEQCFADRSSPGD